MEWIGADGTSLHAIVDHPSPEAQQRRTFGMKLAAFWGTIFCWFLVK